MRVVFVHGACVKDGSCLAVLGSLGTALYRAQVDDVPHPGVASADVHAVHDTLAGATSVAGHVPPALIDSAQTAFMHGMSDVALVTAGLMLGVAALLAFTLREPRAQTAPAAEARERVVEVAAV